MHQSLWLIVGTAFLITLSPIVNAVGNGRGRRSNTPNPTVVGDAYCGVGHYMGNTMESNITIMNSNAGEDWYMFTAPVAGQYSFNTCNSSFDTYIYLFSHVDSGMQGNYSSMIGSQIGECDTWADSENTPTCHACDTGFNQYEVSEHLV